jgi:hypothetical protein
LREALRNRVGRGSGRQKTGKISLHNGQNTMAPGGERAEIDSAIGSEGEWGNYLNGSKDTVSWETLGTGNNRKQPASARGEKMKGVQ